MRTTDNRGRKYWSECRRVYAESTRSNGRTAMVQEPVWLGMWCSVTMCCYVIAALRMCMPLCFTPVITTRS